MSDFVIAVAEPVSIPVAGGGRFPVRRVYCIGRNYAAHAVEMGHDPDREPPFFFQKVTAHPHFKSPRFNGGFRPTSSIEMPFWPRSGATI